MPRWMRYSMGELLDRWTIEKRKEFYGFGNEELLENLKHEIMGRVGQLVPDFESARKLAGALLLGSVLGIHNGDISNLEWQTRMGHQLPDAEVGRRARVIRFINDRGRVAVRQEIDKLMGDSVETRHYGYTSDLQAQDMTLDVQEPGCLPEK